MLLLPFFRVSARALAAIGLGSHLGATAAVEDGIVTDRPDFVESSQVVGAGRFQIETSISAERGRQDGSRTRAYSTPTLLRYGVGDAVELRVETDGRMVEQTTPPSGGSRTTAAGYADTALGMNWHVMDDAAGLPSVAL